MPELPEVETVARDLQRHLPGATIAGVDVRWPRTLRSEDPDAFRAAVVGRTIEAVGRRAKLVVIELGDSLALTIHLKMTGQLFVVPPATPADPFVRVTLELADGRQLRFRDIRKFGRIGLATHDVSVGDLVGELGAKSFRGFGPEPLDPLFTAAAFRRRLRARRGRLKPLLMDQAFLAGVGNIYADEALWAARLHPLRSAGSLRSSDEGRLYRELRRILGEAVDRRGSSIDDYTAPDGDGSMQERLLVYGQAGAPCPRCGHAIRRLVVGGRSTHLCTFCQRLPAGERDDPGVRAILRTMIPRPGARLGRSTEATAEARGRAERTRRAAASRRVAARLSAERRPVEDGGPAPGERPAPGGEPVGRTGPVGG
jgi:formamidopyrimidine-DNA glycosylase